MSKKQMFRDIKQLNSIGDKVRFTLNDEYYEVFIKSSSHRNKMEIIYYKVDNSVKRLGTPKKVRTIEFIDNEIPDKIIKDIIKDIQNWANN